MGWFRKLFAGNTSNTVFAGGTLGGGEPKPFNLPVKSPAKHQTAGDRLDYYTKKHKGTYSIHRGLDKVTVLIHLPSGDVVAGNGPTTMAAVVQATSKLEAAQ